MKKAVHSKISPDGSIISEGRAVQQLKKRPSQYIPREYFNLGMYFLVPLILGLVVGNWLDTRFDTGSFFTILFLLLGVVSVFYNLFSLIKKR